MDTTSCQILITILFLEWIGDFLLQSREMGKTKSEKPSVLIQHLVLLSIPLAVAGWVWGLDPIKWMWFLWLNAAIHGFIDWNIWKGYKYSVLSRLGLIGMDLDHPPIKKQIEEYRYYEDSWFYSTIGLDRFLHVATIIGLYALLF